MRRLPLAAALACLAVPALAQEPDTERWPCNLFRDVAVSAELELSDGWDAATYTYEGAAPETVRLGTCGTGRVGYCARVDGDGEAVVSTIVPVHGWIGEKGDGPATDFLIVDGSGLFVSACEE